MLHLWHVAKTVPRAPTERRRSDELRLRSSRRKLDRYRRRIDLEAKLVFLISARPCRSTFKRKLDWTAAWTIAEMGGY